MTYLIIGRTGSGKDYLAHKLCSKYNLKELKSYTTRPKRIANEDTHIFITPEESNNYKNRIAETIINGYEYFATKEQLDDCDIYLIDPDGLEILLERAPNNNFVIIYVTTLDNLRLTKSVSRLTDVDPEKLSIITDRNNSEEEQFRKFERYLGNCFSIDYITKLICTPSCFTDSNILKYSNVQKIYMYPNGYNEEYCNNWIDVFYNNVIEKYLSNGDEIYV